MQLKIYYVDAFASAPFQGNPAAVCILEEWLPEVLMQAIASEINLSETAFLVQRDTNDFRIRWFTPSVEVNLCGHATLAAAHVLFQDAKIAKAAIRFKSLSGNLSAQRKNLPNDKRGIRLDFPAQLPRATHLAPEYAEAVGGYPQRALENEDLILMYGDASEVEILEPDMLALRKLDYRCIVAAAPGNGNGYDFVCRVFAPSVGINEDPVTGSAYTKLAPYFGEMFNKKELYARQISRRGGDVYAELQGERVIISGEALTIMTAEMTLPDF